MNSPRTYDHVPLAERARERRERMLDSALTLFAARGYRRTAVLDICRATTLSSRQFYEEFKGRGRIAEMVYARVHEAGCEAITRCLRDNDFAAMSVPDRTRCAAQAYITAIGSDQRCPEMLLVQAHAAGVPAEPYRSRLRSLWAAVLCVDEDDVTVTALIGAADAMALRWARSQPQTPVDDLADLLAEFAPALQAA